MNGAAPDTRLLIRSRILGALMFALTGSAALPLHADDSRLELHVLNRLAFGPDAAGLADIRRLGVDGWIDRQLHPEAIPEPAALRERLAALPSQEQDAVTLYQAFEASSPAGADPQAIGTRRQRSAEIVREAATARLVRAIESPRQLQEVMVEFWFNHFNVSARKGLVHLWVGDYENRAIRPHALGRFRDLLEATARHPAMLFYLDNWLNSAPARLEEKRHREGGLNENYARELMELHTLGVDGGYQQDDVVALARILTGWGIASAKDMPGSDNGFSFHPDRHDFSDKIFLGRLIRGEGAAEIEHALDILASSPATARHVSFQLAQYFVTDRPPTALVERLSRRWLKTGGDIRAVLKTLFSSPEFRAPSYFGGKFKTPFEYVVSAVRASGKGDADVQPLMGALARLGQPLYGCLTPDGYRNTREAWLSPDALSLRIAFATALGSGHLRLSRPVDEDGPGAEAGKPAVEPSHPVESDGLIALLDPSGRTRLAVDAAPPALKAAVLLGSPDFMNR